MFFKRYFEDEMNIKFARFEYVLNQNVGLHILKTFLPTKVVDCGSETQL